MNRILDTNVCIDVLRGRKKVVERLGRCRPKECFISAVTEFELFQGVDRAAEERRGVEREKVSRFVSCFQVLPFDSECARIAGGINAASADYFLQRMGRKAGSFETGGKTAEIQEP